MDLQHSEETFHQDTRKEGLGDRNKQVEEDGGKCGWMDRLKRKEEIKEEGRTKRKKN